MTQDEMIAAAKQKAVEHQLYPELVCAICEQESAWNPWAIRYEPAFYARYVGPQSEALRPTESYARAFSWGLMQVMGQVAREHGYNRPFLSQLCDPWEGLEIGCQILASKLARAEGNVKNALLLWNGGANTSYPAQVMERADKYK